MTPDSCKQLHGDPSNDVCYNMNRDYRFAGLIHGTALNVDERFVFDVGDIRFEDKLVLHLMWMRVENYDLKPVIDIKCCLTLLLSRFSMNMANSAVSIKCSNIVVKPIMRA